MASCVFWPDRLMGLDAIKAALPEYAKDIKLNLGSTVGTSTLSAEQAWGTALACAVAARNPVVLREIAAEAADHLKPEAVEAAKRGDPRRAGRAGLTG